MLRISDGRKNFYQWDLNQKLIVDDSAVTQVHYCNSPDGEALVVEVKNGLADVPNIFLTECWTILAFAFDGNSVREAYAFKVEPRAKPVDYIYTPTEVHTWDELNQKINDLVGFDLYDYYTKDEVNQLIGEIDLSAYAKKTDIPSLDGYAKETYVDNAIAAIPETDLSNYYTKTETNSAINNAKPDLTPYVTKTYVDDAIDGITIPSLDGYATEDYVNDAIANIPSGGGSSYMLPIATSETLGGVMPTTKTNSMTQAVGVDDAGGLWTAPGSGGGSSGGANGVWTLYHDITVEEAVNSLSGQIDSSCREILIYIKTAYDENISKYFDVKINGKRVYEETVNRNGDRNNFIHIDLSPENDFLYVVGACSYNPSGYMTNAKAGLQNVGIVGNISSLSGPFTISLSNYGNTGENGSIFAVGSRLKIWGR